MKKRKLIGCLCGWQSTAALAAGWLALTIAKGVQFIVHPAYQNGFDAFLMAGWAVLAAAYALRASRQRKAGRKEAEEERHE